MSDSQPDFRSRIKLVRAKTPLRISFAGGGTDVSPYADEKGGCALNATISLYVYASLAPIPEKVIRVRSLDYDSIVNYSKKEDFNFDGQLDLAKGVFKRFQLDEFSHEGFDLYVHGDAPPGSGLGSSSTFTVTLIGLFREWRGVAFTPYGIAELAYDIERNEIGIKGGRQDQYAASFGGFNFMEFNGGEVVVTPLRLPPQLIHELEYNLILCYTGGVRESQHIIARQMVNFEKGNIDAVEAMDFTKETGLLMRKALLLGKLTRLGELLHEGWEHKKRMAEGITNPFIDQLYAAARECGAVGGKIAGAGGGGYMLLYVPFDKKHKVTRRLTELGGQVVGFRFEPSGMQTWSVFE